ncbi:MAG TPA: hypothetical protein VNK46_03725 [Nitrospiraceae bacterium]|nr:hypothetical protein [Nitrospiraceae bacterium]
MRNRIPCTADRLSLLDPPMIQSVVESTAFQIGHQYVSENRVRIVEADESQISSAVIGNSGLYEQTIKLKDGHLLTKCTCTLVEEPMCRHCVAVLLEYHRWSQPRTAAKRPRETRPRETPYPERPPSGSVPDIKLSEIMIFMEWLQPAVRALEKGQALPEAPTLEAGEVASWIQAIRNLEDRRRESEAVQLALEADMRDREAYVGHLTHQLQISLDETKSAQAARRELQEELASYKTMLARTLEISKEIGRFDGQMKTLAGELMEKGSRLEALAVSFQELAAALRTLGGPPVG